MHHWRLYQKQLPLKFTWKISRGQSSEKTLYFIEVKDKEHVGTGEVAGITADPQQADVLIQQFEHFKKQKVSDLPGLLQLDLPTHLKFGITSAFSHLQAQKQGKTLHQWLNLTNITPLPTSFSLPILPINEIGDFYREFELHRFPVLKLKVSQDQAAESCQELARHYPGPLRIDANEAFPDCKQTLRFIKDIQNLPLQFIEEPLPRGSIDEYKKLKLKSPVPIFADESVQQSLLSETLRDQFHGINVKLMKAGSYQRARQQIEQAKEWKMGIMLGCMVESSLGIAGALTIAADVDHFDLDGFLYFQDEPMHLVAESQGHLTYRQNPKFPLVF